MPSLFKLLLTCLTTILLLVPGRAVSVTRVSVTTGVWTNAASWSPTGAPQCGDTLVITSGHTITINSQVNLSGCGTPNVLYIRGVLYFQGGNKLRLACGSRLYIFQGGAIESDGQGSSNQLEICNTTYWNGTMGSFAGPSCIPAGSPGCFNILLAVDLVRFETLSCSSDKRCFTWETATEKNNDRFELQRSADGLHFTTAIQILSLARNGQSSEKILYRGDDEYTRPGLLYYRLKQIDLDGSFLFSKIITSSMNTNLADGFLIYPNPNNGRFIVKNAQKSGTENVQILITDASGRILHDMPPAILEDDTEFYFENKLSPGLYFMHFVTGEKRFVQKICIKAF